MTSELTIEIEAYKNEEALYFDSLYFEDLTGETSSLVNRFLKDSKGATRLVVYLGSESNDVEIWEKEIVEDNKAAQLLEILREIATKGKHESK